MKIILLMQVEVGAHTEKEIAKNKAKPRGFPSQTGPQLGIILSQMRIQGALWSPVLVLISQCSTTRKLLFLSSFPPWCNGDNSTLQGIWEPCKDVRVKGFRHVLGTQVVLLGSRLNICRHSGGGVDYLSPEDWLPVQLVEGSNRCSGRVEVYFEGVWGTVCDDLWAEKEAQVVCQQLGCGVAVSTLGEAPFGQGSGPILLDDVQCSGTEVSLGQCSHAGWFIHNCGHEEDVGIVCSGKSLPIFPKELIFHFSQSFFFLPDPKETLVTCCLVGSKVLSAHGPRHLPECHLCGISPSWGLRSSRMWISYSTRVLRHPLR